MPCPAPPPRSPEPFTSRGAPHGQQATSCSSAGQAGCCWVGGVSKACILRGVGGEFAVTVPSQGLTPCVARGVLRELPKHIFPLAAIPPASSHHQPKQRTSKGLEWHQSTKAGGSRDGTGWDRTGVCPQCPGWVLAGGWLCQGRSGNKATPGMAEASDVPWQRP